MIAYLLKRLGLAVLVAVTVSAITFLLPHFAGDVAVALAGEGATPEDVENVRRLYGLDRPLVVQYLDWVGGMVQGDFGESIFFRGTKVIDLIAAKLPTTAILAVLALGVALTISIPLGVLAAVRPNSWVDRVSLSIAVVGQALPSFFFALILVLLLAVLLPILPVSGSESWRHFVLPSVALGYYATPAFMRLVRAGMIEVLAADYIRTARANGLSQTRILFKHALRNALVPVVALAAVQLGFLLGGSVVIESVFALDGLGYLAFQSISYSDFPLTQAIVVLLSFVYVGLTLLADFINAWLDPRIRMG
jgi:ABC-type dipeptide/oligopeptide/nickel transport system permease component